MIKKIAHLGFVVGVLFMTGCATILNEETQKIDVRTSNGKSVTAVIDGQSVVVPSIVSVKRSGQDKVLEVADAGCNKETLLTKSVDSVFWVNILSGGAFGSTTDYNTEKMWKYQDTVEITCN